MFRALMKNAYAFTLAHSRMDRLMARRAGLAGIPMVLGYHRVVEDFRRFAPDTIPPMLIGREMFEKHLDHIGRRFDFVTLDEVGRRVDGGRVGGRPAAAITFDDGYRDVYENAFPILRRKGIPAAIFVVTDLIGTDGLQVHDRLHLLLRQAFERWGPEGLSRFLRETGVGVDDSVLLRPMDPTRAMSALLESLPQSEVVEVIDTLAKHFDSPAGAVEAIRSLDWPELREMQQGGVTIGSHTKSHVLLTNEKWDRIVRETRESRKTLEANLGAPVDHFAYPDGRFGTAAVQAVERAGYRYAYTTCLHRDPKRPMLTIPRNVLWERSSVDAFDRFSPSVMSCQMSWAFDMVRACDRTHNGMTAGQVMARQPMTESLK